MCHDSMTQVTTVCEKFRLFWTTLMMVETISPRMLALIYLSTWSQKTKSSVSKVIHIKFTKSLLYCNQDIEIQQKEIYINTEIVLNFYDIWYQVSLCRIYFHSLKL